MMREKRVFKPLSNLSGRLALAIISCNFGKLKKRGKSRSFLVQTQRLWLTGLISLSIAVWILGGGLVFATPRVSAQNTPVEEYFSDTGHSVREPFLTFFKNSGGLTRYGYPITDEYVDPKTGLLVQYFENARLEWHPGNPDPNKILLGRLSDEMGKRTAPKSIKELSNDPNCRNFFETGHSVCWLFRDFWEKNGGVAAFGYPVADYTIENERSVQYFEYALLEWWPEKPAGQTIVLAPLGRIYYEWAKLDPSRLQPHPPNDGQLGSITTLYAKGSVLKPVVNTTATQTAYVLVKDQLNNAINGAAVTLIVHFPGQDKSFTLPPTNSKGTTFQTFPGGQIKPGTTVSMEFIVAYNGLVARTRTSYLVWYGNQP